jgi:micrococcal nuclease
LPKTADPGRLDDLILIPLGGDRRHRAAAGVVARVDRCANGWESRMTRTRWILAAGLWAAAASAASALQGEVMRVDDGDTLWLRTADGKAKEVRLSGIDAPEICQAWGPEARDALKEWVLDRPAVVQPAGHDDKGRLLGALVVDGANINRRMVEEGHAWSLRVKWDNGPFVKQERMAHALGRGLHSMPGAVPPREFLRTHGPCVEAEPAK